MRHKRSYQEIKDDSKTHFKGLAELPPDSMASERFRAPAYQAGQLIRVQGRQMHNRTLRELLDYLLDGVSSGRMTGSQPVPEDVVEYIHGGHIDMVEYLADKFDVKRSVDIGKD